MTTGVLINPAAGKGSGKGLALADKLKGAAGVELVMLDRFERLYDGLEGFAARGVDRVFISSGDGTIQATQTWIAEEGRFASPPRLGLLPHGTTNMDAADLGVETADIEAQAAIVRRDGEDARTKQRATLRIVNPGDARVRHGMFLGTGAIWQAVVYTQRQVHRTGLKGGMLAPVATLVMALGRALFSGPADPNDESRFDRPWPMTVTADGRPVVDSNQTALLATTLERLVMGARPFWGGGEGAIRATAIPYPPPNLVRWTLPVLYGTDDRRLPEGLKSWRCAAMAVACAAPYVLDGEFFEGPDDEPLEIETGPVLTYITG